jgi:chromosome segregation ATPase
MVAAHKLPPDQGTLQEGLNRIQGRVKQLSARVHAQTERATHEFDALRAELESVLELLREARQQVKSSCNSILTFTALRFLRVWLIVWHAFR